MVNGKFGYLIAFCFSFFSSTLYLIDVFPISDTDILSSDALPLSYRRLVGAEVIKLGSWDKHPAYCYDLNGDEWYLRKKCE